MIQPPKNPQAGQIWVHPIDGMPMVFIPVGVFLMGSECSFEAKHLNNAAHARHQWTAPDQERPVHSVYLDGFWIDQYPVTVGQYRNFCAVTKRRMPPLPMHVLLDRTCRPSYPVVNVNWYEAMAYAQWVGKDLPTEAEWEKAARGGLERALYPWGDDPPDESKIPFDLIGIRPVGQFSPNLYNLYDMVGHIYQWCQDWYDPDYYLKGSIGIWHNPRGPAGGAKKVLRGGCWYEVGWEAEVVCRVSHRFALSPHTRYFPGLEGGRIAAIGFRCVLRCS
jgi:sulfatase modifying factor 1